MRKIVLALMALGLISISCSKDDDEKKCDSCEVLSQKAEMCENGDGSYTFSYAGESEKITQAQLDEFELTAEEYLDLVCSAGNF